MTNPTTNPTDQYAPGDRVIAVRDSNAGPTPSNYAYRSGDVGIVQAVKASTLRVTFDGQDRPSNVSVSTDFGNVPGVRKLTLDELRARETAWLNKPPEIVSIDETARWVEVFAAVESARRLRKCVLHAAMWVAERGSELDLSGQSQEDHHADAVVSWQPKQRILGHLPEDRELTLCAGCAENAIRAALNHRGLVPYRVVWLKS